MPPYPGSSCAFILYPWILCLQFISMDPVLQFILLDPHPAHCTPPSSAPWQNTITPAMQNNASLSWILKKIVHGSSERMSGLHFSPLLQMAFPARKAGLRAALSLTPLQVSPNFSSRHLGTSHCPGTVLVLASWG